MADEVTAAQPESAVTTPEGGASLLNKADEKPAGEVAPENKPETSDGTKAPDEQADNKDAKAAEPPERYELKLPEGTIIDQPMMDEFTGWAKGLKLNNEQAQAAADLHLKVLGNFAQQQAQLQANEFVAQQKQWIKEFGDDKDLGGAKADETLNIARKGMNALGATDRLKQELDRTGLGNHPDLIKIFHAVGKFVGDDGVIMGKQPDQQVQDMATKWYPTTPPTS